VAGAALLLRIAVRLSSGEADFWENGYSFLFDLARSIAAGHGLAFDGQGPTADRVPLYPLFLAAVTMGRRAFFSIVIAQSLIGAATVVSVGLLAAELFGAGTALLAAAFAAVYPYYVVHDTAMQDTALFTLLTLVSILLLVRVRRSMSGRLAAVAGLVLAADVLTRASIAPFAVFAPLWLGWAGTAEPGKRLKVSLLCAAMLVIGVAPWLVRSYVVTGAAILQSDTGWRLWDGNNRYTFSHYPLESIDLSKATALEALSAAEQAELDALAADDVRVDRLFMHKAVTFIRENPWLTVANGLRKIRAAFSWLPSPRRSVWPTIAYSVSYGPIMVLGLLGMALSRRSWREHSLIYGLFLSFVAVTAVFFGHTSHRAFLDVYWMAYAASVLTGSIPGRSSI
jgi:4-amino-4-deoxy-L-arabinose transferase-like glycosyltransferase